MTRKKYTSKFKFKVVLEALKERQTLAELAQKFNVTPQQISQWKRAFLDEGDTVFEKGKSSKKSEAEEEKDKLLKIIGEQKVAIDFLNQSLR